MDVEITQINCCNCNVVFWLTEEHQKRLVRCKNTFYCPNGHPQSYAGKSDAQKIENLERELHCEKRESKSLERSNAALRGVITKNKKKNS